VYAIVFDFDLALIKANYGDPYDDAYQDMARVSP
jgi:virulence-associated protein VapD